MKVLLLTVDPFGGRVVNLELFPEDVAHGYLALKRQAVIFSCNTNDNHCFKTHSMNPGCKGAFVRQLDKKKKKRKFTRKPFHNALR